MADADLVLEERGVTALTSATEPYALHRVSGTSAGAALGSMLAAG
jgi:hypothetical protein